MNTRIHAVDALGIVLLVIALVLFGLAGTA